MFVLEVERRQISVRIGANIQSSGLPTILLCPNMIFNFYYVTWVRELRKNLRTAPSYMLLREVT